MPTHRHSHSQHRHRHRHHSKNHRSMSSLDNGSNVLKLSPKVDALQSPKVSGALVTLPASTTPSLQLSAPIMQSRLSKCSIKELISNDSDDDDDSLTSSSDDILNISHRYSNDIYSLVKTGDIICLQLNTNAPQKFTLEDSNYFPKKYVEFLVPSMSDKGFDILSITADGIVSTSDVVLQTCVTYI